MASHDSSASSCWPFFGLRLKTLRLELRPPTDEDLFALAALSRRGVHDPATMPFADGWSALPSPERERALLRRHWSNRVNFDTDNWCLSVVVVLDDTVIGCQEVSAEKFMLRRVTQSARSWIGREYQSRGFGKEARAAALRLMFDGLGAHAAVTGVFSNNLISQRLVERLGYERNGRDVAVTGTGGAIDVLKYRLTKARWAETSRAMYDVEIEGLEPCLPFFGLDLTTTGGLTERLSPSGRDEARR